MAGLPSSTETGTGTDRDIYCREVAEGKSPETPVTEVVSTTAATVTLDPNLKNNCKTFEKISFGMRWTTAQGKMNRYTPAGPSRVFSHHSRILQKSG